MKWTALLGIALWPAACLPGDRGLPPTARAQTAATDSIPAQIIPNGRTVETRFPVPAGFVRPGTVRMIVVPEPERAERLEGIDRVWGDEIDLGDVSVE